jgi:DNA-binding CsgD family transcriptional regulator
VDEPGAWPWPDVYANALVVEGRYDDADAFLRPHEALALERGHRSATARLGYARGRLLGAQGDLHAAREFFERSRALLADTPLRWDRARVGFAYGQTLRRAGKRREADAVMVTARDLYAALGATTYVARCDRELKAGGVHAARGAEQPVDALTPQEEAVAELVASGLSNREVAAELFVSMKTVQYHLTRIYAKLGVRSRTELAVQRAGGD